MTIPRAARAIGLGLGLFLAVYAPAFLAVAWLRPPAEMAVPVIIGVSLTIALALIWALGRGRADGPAFGFSLPSRRYVGLAVVIGLPLALVAGWLGHQFPSQGPISTAGFPPWMLWLYFGLGASIQEEVIFRGLIQSFLARSWPAPVATWRLSAPVWLTAALFGVIHLDSGWVVAASALALGLVAGELRRRSRSLLPAVIVHALFNLPDLVWR